MVRSDLACSGVMFSIDTETGFQEAVLLTAAYGLGENVVQGVVNPDEFLIHKPTLELGFAPIVGKRLGSKNLRLVLNPSGSAEAQAGHPVRNEAVPLAEQERYALSDQEALQLARWAVLVERHYSAKRGAQTPMDLEWAKFSNRVIVVSPSNCVLTLLTKPSTFLRNNWFDILRFFQSLECVNSINKAFSGCKFGLPAFKLIGSA
jgi:phosphoenolpyruvate synthase/pyruvate phosphate dikinase